MEPIIVSATFDVSLETVWNALSQEAELKKWYFLVENYVFEVGNTFSFYESEHSKEFFHECEFLTIVPHQLIEYTWTHPEQSKGSSVVQWKFEAVGAKTKVTLAHTGVESFADGGEKFAKANYQMGWTAIVTTMLRNYLYGIEKLEFEVEIKASAAKVWRVLWSKETYTEWTQIFCEGSYYEGDLKQGNRVHLLSSSGEGMYSEVLFYKENELLIFRHIGMLKDKKELPIDAETERWTGCFETYKLQETGGKTMLKAEVDTIDNYVDYMKKTFPVALQKIKSLSETNLI